MSERQSREETPEPEERSNQLVEQNPPHKHIWDVEDQIRALVRATVQFGDLTSDEGQKHFPEFPQLHDQTWLTLQTKIKNTISTTESFFRKADSNGWFREQAIPRRPGSKQRPTKQSLEMGRLCDRVTNLLEDTTALQGQILAGQHRKPSGEKRLDRPEFVPFTRRLTDSHANSEDFRGSINALKDRVDQFGTKAVLMKHGIKRRRFAFELAPLKELEQTKWRQEQLNARPSLVLDKHESLKFIKENKGYIQPWAPYIKSLSTFMKEIEACQRDGHPPKFGPFLQDAYYEIPQLPKSVEDEDDQEYLPSICNTFNGEPFMETAFAGQVKTMKTLSILPREKRESDMVAEEARQALTAESLKRPDLRIATRHKYPTGALEVGQYHRDRNNFFLAHEHWANIAKPEFTHPAGGRKVLDLTVLEDGDFEIPQMSPRKRTREWVDGQNRIV